MRGRAALILSSALALMALQVAPQGQTSGHQVLVDLQPEGGTPEARLLRASDGSLYGTSCRGGQYGEGSIYRLTPAFQTVWSLRRNTDGACPMAGLMEASDGFLYGTASQSGPSVFNDGVGTIFRIAPAGGPLEVLHTFRQSGTGNPRSELLKYAGYFYGTTYGAAGPSEVFRFALPAPGSTASIETLHVFTGPDGANLLALVEN